MLDIHFGETSSTWPAILLSIAPLGAPIAVVIVQYLQNIWQRDFAKDQLEASKRSLQLAAMDKRITVLDAITVALAQINYGSIDAATRSNLYKNLIAGQMLFDSDIAERLQKAWTMLNEHQVMRSENHQNVESIGDKLFTALYEIRSDMIARGTIVSAKG